MQHQRIQVRFEQERFGPKADVCWDCSDPGNGIWVPVSFCPDTSARLPDTWGPGEVDGYYTVPDAPSMWDEEPYDPLDRWDQYDGYLGGVA